MYFCKINSFFPSTALVVFILPPIIRVGIALLIRCCIPPPTLSQSRFRHASTSFQLPSTPHRHDRRRQQAVFVACENLYFSDQSLMAAHQMDHFVFGVQATIARELLLLLLPPHHGHNGLFLRLHSTFFSHTTLAPISMYVQCTTGCISSAGAKYRNISPPFQR